MHKKIIHVTVLGCSAKLFLLEHFKRLKEEGFDILLACVDDEDAKYCVRELDLSHIPIPFKQNIAPFSDIFNLIRMWCNFRKIKPVIVHSHMSKAGLIGSLAAWLARVPVRIYHNHGMALLSSKGLKYGLLYCTERLACACASKIIFVSPSNRDDAVRLGLCSDQKSSVLGPGTISGIDLEKFDPDRNRQRGVSLRCNAGIPLDDWLVGFVARIVPHKGVETILQAWRKLPEDVIKRAWLCFFGSYGDEKMKQLLLQAVEEKGLHVKYMGFCEDLPAWYATMDLLVQPSWHEGWGYNVLEAACSAVPAVGTRISATVDAIIDGQTGILVPVKNPEKMAKAIVSLLKNEQLRKRLGLAARERTLKFFSQDKICSLLVSEYKQLLRSRRLIKDE